MEITVVRHPKSGELYAVRKNADGDIVQAAGPLVDGDGKDRESLEMNIDNQGYAAFDDGEWLQAEFDKAGQ